MIEQASGEGCSTKRSMTRMSFGAFVLLTAKASGTSHPQIAVSTLLQRY